MLALAGILAGCAPLPTGADAESAYECRIESADAGASAGATLVPAATPPFVVMTIELTNQGELAHRCQWTEVLHALRLERPQIVVMYVHGWGHDGNAEDADLARFGAYVAELARREASRQTPRQVVGIYIGWPGTLSDLPVVHELTYWSRQRAADRISQSAVVSKLVGAIHSVRRKARQSNDFIVFVGHSFGARILYTATSQLILYNLQTQHPGYRGGSYGTVRGPAHLTVLLNPAMEASAYTALDTVRRVQERFDPDQQPVLLTISTSNDLATLAAFPLGQWLGGLWHGRDVETLGNYAPYVTHHLERQAGGQPEQSDWWYDAFCRSALCLRRTERRQPGNPFIVARTTGEILDGHSGIWAPDFLRWLDAFVEQVDQRKSSAPTRPGEIAVPQ